MIFIPISNGNVCFISGIMTLLIQMFHATMESLLVDQTYTTYTTIQVILMIRLMPCKIINTQPYQWLILIFKQKRIPFMNETTLKIFNRTLHIKKQWKITFLATWIGGMLAHAYRFFNFLPSWDSMYNFAGTGATYSSGRCFLEFFSKISSKYDMPWVNGALSLLYISLASILLVELFELQECASAYCSPCSLFLSLPSQHPSHLCSLLTVT